MQLRARRNDNFVVLRSFSFEIFHIFLSLKLNLVLRVFSFAQGSGTRAKSVIGESLGTRLSETPVPIEKIIFPSVDCMHIRTDVLQNVYVIQLN